MDALTKAFGSTCVAGMKNAVLGMDERTIDLQKAYNALVSKYQQVYGGALVEFDGKQLTIPKLGPYKEITDLDKTEENRKLVENFLYDVMQGNNLDKTPDYFDGDTYIQHNTGIADGVSGLNAALGAMAEQGISMVYDEVHMVLAQGNFVLAVSEGTFSGEPTSYYDLWRVENGKIAEHWDVMETIADQSTWQNENGKF